MWKIGAICLCGVVVYMAGCTCNGNPAGRRSCDSASDCRAGEVCLDGYCQEQTHIPDADTDSSQPDGGRDCIDFDNDGYGEGPDCHGPDCDDHDRLQTGVEVCDGEDNDCDGVADNGVLSDCGDCNPDCIAIPFGIGTDHPFDLGRDDNEGVNLDEDGAVVLDSISVNTDFIWIANTGAGQVVKVDTDTFEEMGRYETGSDPSRTSVNTAGDVYVGNRGGRSVTKISVLGEECPDTNGDGVITTSAGGGDVLPFGQDDCMLWRTDFGEHGLNIRAVAAQDEFGPDGDMHPYVWIGGWNLSGLAMIWKLDGVDGSVLLSTESPAEAYGFALDAAGNLWISGLRGQLGRIDTNRCVDDASCTVATCAGETAECDAAVKQSITQPSGGYGITVDFQQRVWLGGAVMRYDPSAPIGERWALPNAGVSCNGIGADAHGWVYAACQGNRSILRINSDNPSEHVLVSTNSNRGVAIDADGKVWGINMISNAGTANVLTPGPTINDNPVQLNVGPTLSSPYTYSDMTGLQLRLATNPRGYYRTVFEGCQPTVDTAWGELSWEVETPEGTFVTVRARAADTREGLETADWFVVAELPPDEPPIEMSDELLDQGITEYRYIELELLLQAERQSTSEVITPRILSVEQQFECPIIIG